MHIYIYIYIYISYIQIDYRFDCKQIEFPDTLFSVYRTTK